MSTTFGTDTVIRTTAMFAEGDEPEFRLTARTTIVVTRAVLDDVIGGNRVLEIHGYRKEKPPAYSGWRNPGGEPKTYTFRPDKCPFDIGHIVRRLENRE